MGFFDKKYCDFCGGKIGLLGNRKLEDGNMCKDCAKQLSPWFSERRHSTKADIQRQLEYREANKKAVAAFHVTRTLGTGMKLLMDEDKRQFMVTDAKELDEANPDVLDYSQATGCTFNIDEHRSEMHYTNKEGKSVSYRPPRYKYWYTFEIVLQVNHPWFSEIRFPLGGSVNTGETAMGSSNAFGAADFRRSGSLFGSGGTTEFKERVRLGNDIKAAVDAMHQQTRRDVQQQKVPKQAVTCPWCGATTLPDASGRCEYCGGAVND